MKYEYQFDYLPCQSCTAKIHCDDCAREVQQRLTRQRGVGAVAMDIPNHHIAVTADGIDEDDLLDLLEDAGVFAD